MEASGRNIYEKLNAPAEEAYKVLRTNIQFCEYNKKIKTITVTSYSPGEGKTTTAINLATSMAGAGMKVLYVDADLRKPMLMKHLGNESFKGLSNYLSGHATLDEILNTTAIEGFYFVTCGVKPPNPAELMDSIKFKEFLRGVSKDFDLVLVDTPPVGSAIDSTLTAVQTDGTIIVIETNKVGIQNIHRLKEQLQKAGVRILGVVLNKVCKADYKNYFNGYDYYGSRMKFRKGWIKKLKTKGKR